MISERELVRAALDALGIRRLALAVHDAALPRHPRDQAESLELFVTRQREWLDRDALYAAAATEHGELDWLRWPQADRALWERIPGAQPAQQARRSELAAKHARPIERYRFGQW